jgi:hypothetical protein
MGGDVNSCPIHCFPVVITHLYALLPMRQRLSHECCSRCAYAMLLRQRPQHACC